MVTTDPELKKLIDPLNAKEREDLENSIRENGFNPALPIILWKGQDIVVDGHNRLEICQKLGIKPVFTEQEFKTIEEVKEFMVNLQISRRNLTPEQLKYYRGTTQNKEKAGHGGARCEGRNLKTNERLAEKFGVSARTIADDGKFSSAVDKICKVCGINRQDLFGKFKVSDIIELGELPENKIEKGLEKLKKMEKEKAKKKKASVSFSYMFKFDDEINDMLITMSRGEDQAFIEGLIREKYATLKGVQ